LEHHAPANVAYALDQLSAFEAADLFRRLDDRAIDALRGGIGAQALKAAVFDLGAGAVRAIAPHAGRAGVLRAQGAWGQTLRAHAIRIGSSGAVRIDGGQLLSGEAFAQLVSGPRDRMERYFEAAGVLARVEQPDRMAKATAEEIDAIAKIVSARRAGD